MATYDLEPAHSVADDAETGTHFSETASIAPSTAESRVSTKGLFTCISCQVGFTTADAQREHYKSDWHRYNLKRKVALLPPVSEDGFKQRMLAQQNKTREDVERAQFSAECVACNKTYYTHNAYQNHLQSNKHRDAMLAYEKKHGAGQKSAPGSASHPKVAAAVIGASADTDSASQRSGNESNGAQGPSQHQVLEWKRRLADAKTEEEIEKIADEKIAAAVRLNPDADCLFCSHQSGDLEANLEHMSISHTFFIPDIDFISDVRGLVSYLGEKISVGNTCIYCNGKGRQLHTLDAVRKHMVDKGHTKVAYEDGADEEISRFYAFPDDDGSEGSGSDEDFAAASNGAELVLPDGRKIGHRSLRTFYKQNFVGPMMSSGGQGASNLLAAKLAQQYRFLGAAPSSSSAGALVPVGMSGVQALVSLRNVEQVAKAARKERRAKVVAQRTQRREELMFGMKGNSQKHYRAQVDF
ncbi:hypothetical protein M427DRAFT_31992 [Gonapodya prolifera JEL478]|uniref:C2H2-type domain-containing protein n=1 Tax=Gonapodya prolifera (strain JEL478) TaxID=1344416 RepID=A0A139AH86_GONPJ|nr:hypothetical protein M427DRAFT_31992 [Gonapodya prolifera JEL478]|eukprot:KXS15805.1 hypothetical protein M427DRAFT_31992 [Gonapodya prolifera JEL478]